MKILFFQATVATDFQAIVKILPYVILHTEVLCFIHWRPLLPISQLFSVNSKYKFKPSHGNQVLKSFILSGRIIKFRNFILLKQNVN